MRLRGNLEKSVMMAVAFNSHIPDLMLLIENTMAWIRKDNMLLYWCLAYKRVVSDKQFGEHQVEIMHMPLMNSSEGIYLTKHQLYQDKVPIPMIQILFTRCTVVPG